MLFANAPKNTQISHDAAQFLFSDGDQEKTVSVLLDGDESMLAFLEPTDDQVGVSSSWKKLLFALNLYSVLIFRLVPTLIH